MKMNPYVSFKGDCEEAFRIYEKALGGRLGEIFRYGGSPMAGTVPPDWADKVMHGSIEIGGQVMMGGDVAPDRYESPRGVSLSLQIADPADAERIFADLAREGTVIMPLEKTFWAERFGMLVDRFGVSWLVNCEAAR